MTGEEVFEGLSMIYFEQRMDRDMLREWNSTIAKHSNLSALGHSLNTNDLQSEVHRVMIQDLKASQSGSTTTTALPPPGRVRVNWGSSD